MHCLTSLKIIAESSCHPGTFDATCICWLYLQCPTLFRHSTSNTDTLKLPDVTRISEAISEVGPWIPRPDFPALGLAPFGGQWECSPDSIDWMNPVAMLAVQSPEPHLEKVLSRHFMENQSMKPLSYRFFGTHSTELLTTSTRWKIHYFTGHPRLKND